MGRARIRTGLAVVGGCAALAVVAPPLAALCNLVGSLTLLLLAVYAAYRAWAFLEAVVEASRRPVTVRRNRQEVPGREPALSPPRRARSPEREPDPPERPLRLPAGRAAHGEPAFRDR